MILQGPPTVSISLSIHQLDSAIDLWNTSGPGEHEECITVSHLFIVQMEVVFYMDTKQAYFPPASDKVEWKSQMMDGRLKRGCLAWCELFLDAVS